MLFTLSANRSQVFPWPLFSRSASNSSSFPSTGPGPPILLLGAMTELSTNVFQTA